MRDLYEFLNSQSGDRLLGYCVFILIFINIIVNGIVNALKNINNKKQKVTNNELNKD